MSQRLRLARWARGAGRSPIQEMLALASEPDVLSLALGLPAAASFPTAAFQEAMAQVLRDDPRALQYGPAIHELKEHVVTIMARRGVRCRPDEVFLTSGAQQGLSLLCRLMLEPGDRIVADALAYPGFRQAIAPFSPEVEAVPVDPASGTRLDALEAALASGPKPPFLYVTADGHNPTGASLSPADRRRLIEIASRHGVTVVEDDPYGLLTYAEEAAPALRALDEDVVFYVGSFSKLMAPALRLGWLVVPSSLHPTLSALKEASDIDTATLTQRALVRLLGTGMLAAHIERLRALYRARRDAALAALDRHLPGASYNRPSSGFFAWVELPPGLDAGAMLAHAIRDHRVAYLPGRAFTWDGAGAERALRLSFSHLEPAALDEAIARLARAVGASDALAPAEGRL